MPLVSVGVDMSGGEVEGVGLSVGVSEGLSVFGGVSFVRAGEFSGWKSVGRVAGRTMGEFPATVLDTTPSEVVGGGVGVAGWDPSASRSTVAASESGNLEKMSTLLTRF